MVLSRGYVAEKEDETEGEDEGGEGGRGTRESRTYAGPYRRVHIRRLEANREKAERADGKEKKKCRIPRIRGLPPGAANARTSVMRKRFRAG